MARVRGCSRIGAASGGGISITRRFKRGSGVVDLAAPCWDGAVCESLRNEGGGSWVIIWGNCDASTRIKWNHALSFKALISCMPEMGPIGKVEGRGESKAGISSVQVWRQRASESGTAERTDVLVSGGVAHGRDEDGVDVGIRREELALAAQVGRDVAPADCPAHLRHASIDLRGEGGGGEGEKGGDEGKHENSRSSTG